MYWLVYSFPMKPRSWNVTIKALAGTDPLGGPALIAMEKSLVVTGRNELEAKVASQFKHGLRLRGHRVEFWIEGDLYLDPRF